MKACTQHNGTQGTRWGSHVLMYKFSGFQYMYRLRHLKKIKCKLNFFCFQKDKKKGKDEKGFVSGLLGEVTNKYTSS